MRLRGGDGIGEVGEIEQRRKWRVGRVVCLGFCFRGGSGIMARVNELRIRAVAEGLGVLLAGVPGQALVDFARVHGSSLPGGFRKEQPESVRLALGNLLARRPSEEFDPALRRLLSSPTGVCQVIAQWDEEALPRLVEGAAVVAGEGFVLACLLVDGRDEVRQFALARLEGDEPLFAAAGSVSQLIPPKSSAPASAVDEKAARKAERAERGAAQKLAVAEAKLARLSEESATASAEVRRLRAECEGLRVELAREQGDREGRVASAVEARLATEFFGWIGKAQTAVAEVERGTGEVEDFARLALAKQAEADRMAGSRFALEERLRGLEVLRGEIGGVLAGALRQVPELAEAQRRVIAECERLRNVLDTPLGDAVQEPWLKRLAERIGGAAGDELSALRVLPERLHALGIIEARAVENLQGLWRQRVAAVQATGGFLDKDAPEEERAPIVVKLEQALAGACPAAVLLDGHNVLYALPGRYSPGRGKARAESEKRDLVVRDLVRVLENAPAVRGWVVFDGATRSDASPSGNVRVSYSGGEGEHRADGVLLDKIRFFRESAPEMILFLVSNDNGLCGAARKLGAESMAVHLFGSFLQ